MISTVPCQPCPNLFDPVFALPPVSSSDFCRSTFRQAQLQLIQSKSSTMPTQPRRVARDRSDHMTTDELSDQPPSGVKFHRGAYGGCKVADVRSSPRRDLAHGHSHGLAIGPVRVQPPWPSHSLSYSDLQQPDQDFAIVRPTFSTVSHGGATSLTRHQHIRETGSKQHIIIDTRISENSRTARFPPYEI